MDAFFASVELLRYPQLKGLPVVIGGGRRSADETLQSAWSDVAEKDIPRDVFPKLSGYTGRGVITTATYPARQFGVGSAMGLMKAAKLCPEAILLPVDYDRYKKYSTAFKEVIREIAPTMESGGIDEVFIEFTDVPGGQRGGGKSLARLIQKSILDATGLTCSVGVAPNKLLAKMASEFKKPNGISIVFEEDLATMIWPLACRKINGVGPKADNKLRGLGINTIGELAQKELDWLIDQFGQRYGAWLHDAAWGRDIRQVVTSSEPVTVSRETTFERDLHAVRDKILLTSILTMLCEQVSADLQHKGYAGRTISVKLRDDRFKTVTRNHSIQMPIDDFVGIRQAAGQALKRAPLDRPLRLLGVRVDGLVRRDSLTLEEHESNQDSSQSNLF
jgi:DNA polymerase-4